MMTAPVSRIELPGMGTSLVTRRKPFFASLCFLLYFASTFPSEAEDKLVRYPGSSDMKSPTGLYVLSSIDNENFEPSHILVVRSIRTDKEEIRIPYTRYIEAAWSPDGNRLAVNDHGGSNYTDCKVISFGKNVRSIELIEQLRAKINPPSITRNHHVFLECVEWLGNDTLGIKTHGYGDLDPNGFSESYIFHVEAGLFEANAHKVR